jgi:hypothetical protein
MVNGARNFSECNRLLISAIPQEVNDFIDSMTLEELLMKDPKSDMPLLWHILLRSAMDKEVGLAFSKRIMDFMDHLTIENFSISQADPTGYGTITLSSLMGSEPDICFLYKALSHQNKAFLQVILSRFSGIFPEDYVVALQSQQQVAGSVDLMPVIDSRNTLFKAVASKPLTDDAIQFEELKELALAAYKAGYTFACHYLADQYSLQGCFIQALEIARMTPKYSSKQIEHFNFELASQHYQTFLASPLDDRTELLKDVLRYSVGCHEDERASFLKKVSEVFVTQKRDLTSQCAWQLNPLYLQVSHDDDEAACQWWVDLLLDSKQKFEMHEVRHTQANSLVQRIAKLKTELEEKQTQLSLKSSDANSNFQKISTVLTQFDSQLKGLKALQPLTTNDLREKFELSHGPRRKVPRGN